MEQVVATEHDNATHIGRQEFTIELLNWNDEIPIFAQSLYSVEVNETIAADQSLIKVTANDRDIGDTVEYVNNICNSHMNFIHGDPDIVLSFTGIALSASPNCQSQKRAKFEPKSRTHSTTIASAWSLFKSRPPTHCRSTELLTYIPPTHNCKFTSSM